MNSGERQRKGRALSWLGLGAATLMVLAACSPGGFSSMPGFGNPQTDGAGLPLAAGQTFGKGPVRVALLLPLTGEPGLATVGVSMANASQLAVGFIESNENIADNITVVLVQAFADQIHTAAGKTIALPSKCSSITVRMRSTGAPRSSSGIDCTTRDAGPISPRKDRAFSTASPPLAAT